jgi:hypothetical protein
MTKYGINLSHCIFLLDTSILAKKSRHMDKINWEATEIELYEET